LDEEIEDGQISKEDGSWTTQQAEKSTVGCFGAPREKEGKTAGEALKTWVKLT
jgi:hypothetical protein